MKISVNEFVLLQNKITNSNEEAFKNGIKAEKSRKLPNNFFESLLDYAKSKDILVDYHESSNETDGCYWIQIKPTRTDSELVDYVEISFNENLMEIDYIGVGKKENQLH